MSDTIDPRAIQGLVARGYGKLHHAAFVLLGITDVPRARVWLRGLPITSAADATDRRALNLAFTYQGLQQLGLDVQALAGLAEEMREGMVTDHRKRILGDHGTSAPENWEWGAPPAPKPVVGTADGIAAGLGIGVPVPAPAAEEIRAGGTRKVRAEDTHALLLYYFEAKQDLDDAIAALIDGEAEEGVTVLKVLRTSWLAGGKEHFGFADGIAQPGVRGLHGDGSDDANAVAAGEILLGYKNEYGRYPVSPRVAFDSELLADRDFGRDGSYLVVRQLEQDVPGFWSWVTEAAQRLRVAEVWGKGEDPRIRLASKMVGRWPSGAPLATCPMKDDPSQAAADDFKYSRDPHGMACPLGSHVRRSNPRDWLLGDDPEESARNSRRHRLLRRGRTYGDPLVDSMETTALAAAGDDGLPRGLLFACLNADIGRQFEFVQHTWINNPKFAGLTGDADPVMGDHEPPASRSRKEAIEPAFTAPARPVRVRATGIKRFAHVRGGGYFFLPSMRALAYLASL